MRYCYRPLALWAALALPATVAGQHRLSAVGLRAGLGLLTPHWATADVDVANMRLTNHREARPERLTRQAGLYARFTSPASRWYMQPEVQGTVAKGYSYVTASVDGGWGGISYFYRQLRRLDAGVLVGSRLGHGPVHVAAGPALAYNQADDAYRSGIGSTQALLDVVAASPRRLQALGRAAVGVRGGRFGLELRYELGLTRYINQFRYREQTYQLPLNNHLLLLSLSADILRWQHQKIPHFR
ncbi:hypothetical protein LJ737_08365 [Hymenobacter sp. 15J16-1T3B]|uniref:hypothetical protein n=1 Tax=Hymenobacter sp. 15J16-1T3B TaxID=2886941 RepID=UPI001D12B74B|nr:hypothetical protein [Hymenobacter sp. 15J16-1T3B]MCC3157249.1 hypothetical protein [Hymenobacter sp. 15J16-1T3B]